MLVENVASGTLLPNFDIPTTGCTREETTIGGEGHFCWRTLAYKIEKEAGIWGIPYQDCPFEDEGESGEDREEQEFA